MIRTVMVVEDDDAIRMVLRTNLEDEGYRVLEATTAEQGLLIVQDEQPDVVLVDLRLPGIHGLDLVRSLRATSHFFGPLHSAARLRVIPYRRSWHASPGQRATDA